MSDLPGERPTIELVHEQLKAIPEVLAELRSVASKYEIMNEMCAKLFREIQEWRYKLEKRVEDVERRVTKIEWHLDRDRDTERPPAEPMEAGGE